MTPRYRGFDNDCCHWFFPTSFASDGDDTTTSHFIHCLTMTTNNQEALDAAVAAMTGTQSLYDVTIICTTDDHQAEYWMKRLSEGLCASNDPDSVFPMVLAVSEDWGAGGAGNGLGTLYAFQKATKLAKEKYNVDIAELLKEGKISAALYHTAGKGTRMAPLPASENNNKPGVVRTKEEK